MSAMKTYYVYTGVDTQTYPKSPSSIPFDCENVPEGAKLLFISPYSNLLHYYDENAIKRPIDLTVSIHKVFNYEYAGSYSYFKLV